MGDDSKIVPKASAFQMKEDHPSHDYSTPITCDKLDGSNYAAWSVVHTLQLLVVVWRASSVERKLLCLPLQMPILNMKKIIIWYSHGFSIP
ncbi:unnamed protein product [Prunus armeniaca]|uniref:Retrotransposon Copia-like N-terminal domain-containing protein n=1 Tax=Prunus armeniaca TaxID=36596 RepID=A0A6J5VA79_PRUAR|nr:unnamed protein product [Prunus armeniaca]